MHSDFQLLSATNRNLEEEVEVGRFRRDLYFRLKTFQLALPPLKERLDDLHLLVRYFLRQLNQVSTEKQVADITPRALQLLRQYDWPGNIRELKHVVEHAFVLCDKKQIDIQDLPLEISQPSNQQNITFEEVLPLEEAIAAYVKFAYEKNKRQATYTMKELNIDHRRLQRYLGERVEKRLQLPAEKDVELEAVKIADALMGDAQMSEIQKTAVQRALIEAIINAVEHGQPADGKVFVDFLMTARQFKITIRDAGKGFAPLEETEHPGIEERIKRGKTRGWGLDTIRKTMDQVSICLLYTSPSPRDPE